MQMTPELSMMIQAAEVCIDRFIPFVIYSLPGKEEVEFFASLPNAEGLSPAPADPDADSFFISRFGADEPYMAGVKASMSINDILEWASANPDTRFEPPCEFPVRSSTLRSGWEKAFRSVRKRLRATKGKVVLSRHTALFSSRPLVPLALEYISLNPANFGYLCFTPETGVWYGSTPELLLETDGKGEFRTMALAGTRWDDSEPWDSKNIAEHAFVSSYITHRLAIAGLDVEVGDVTTLSTNGVEHLMTPIKARGNAEFPTLLSLLNPTPAVAGVPLDVAMAEIDLFETHQRRCYAGAVGLRLGGISRAFVNLRCAFAAPAVALKGSLPGWIHNVYAGGGLVADSDPKMEWEELNRKSLALLKVITDGDIYSSIEPHTVQLKYLKSHPF